MIVLSETKSLEEYFMDVQSRKEKNRVISLTYAKKGYFQIEITNYPSLFRLV